MVRTKVDFYSDYIDSEERNGRRTDEILDDLGDPQLIAKSIVDAEISGPDGIPGTADDRDYSKEIYGNGNGPSSSGWGGFGSGSSDSSGSTRSGSGYGSSSGYGRAGSGSTSGSSNGNADNPWSNYVHTYQIGCLASILILIVAVVLIGFIGAALAPVLVPAVMVILIIWLFERLG